MKFLLLLALCCSCSSKSEYNTNEYEDEDFASLMEMSDSKDITLKSKRIKK